MDTNPLSEAQTARVLAAKCYRLKCEHNRLSDEIYILEKLLDAEKRVYELARRVGVVNAWMPRETELAAELRAWLIEEADISPNRVDAVLGVLDNNDVDTVKDLARWAKVACLNESLKPLTADKIREALASRERSLCAPPTSPSAAELQPPAYSYDGNLPGPARSGREASLQAGGVRALVSPESPAPSATPGEPDEAYPPVRAAPTPPIVVNKAGRPTQLACFGCQLQRPSTPTHQLEQLPIPIRGGVPPRDRVCERCKTNGLRIPRSRVRGVKFLHEISDPGGALKTEPWFCLKNFGTSPPIAYTNSCSPDKLRADKRCCSVIILKNEDDWSSVLEATMDSGKVVRRIADEKLVEIPKEWFDGDLLCLEWGGRPEQFILAGGSRKRKAQASPDAAPAPAEPAHAVPAGASPAPLQEDAPALVSDYERNPAGWTSDFEHTAEELEELQREYADLVASGAGASGVGSSGVGSSGGDGAYRSLGGAHEEGGSPQFTNCGAGDDGPPRLTSCSAGADEGEHQPVMRSLGEDQGQGSTAFTPPGGAGEAEEAEEGEEISELLAQAEEHLRYGALRAAKIVLQRVKALKAHARRALIP